MFMDNKKILYMLLLIFFIIAPVNANIENVIGTQNTQNSVTSDLEYYWETNDCLSEMEKMVDSQKFQEYLKIHGIDKDNYDLKFVPSFSNVPVKVIVHTPNQELHYSITEVDSYYFAANNMQTFSVGASSSKRFAVANRCGKTLGAVWVAYYRTVAGRYGPIPIDRRQSTRHNLQNNDQLNYNPSAEFDTATINIYENWPQIGASASKFLVSLGNWHVAYVKKDRNMYIHLE